MICFSKVRRRRVGPPRNIILALPALVEIPMTTTDLITAGELLQMQDDGFLYELVRGELVK